jgi:glucose/arabinose dehydrogenase
MAFYGATTCPTEYLSAFVTLHGSWNRGSAPS